MDKSPRLQLKYRKEVLSQLMADFKYKTVMAAPKIQKVTLNIGFGRMVKDTKFIEKLETDLTKLAGQKPAFRKAKKSIAGFKLREGVDIGIVVTLRGKRMYDFIDRLVSIALPRTRDFHGLNPKSFDRQGNLSIGIKEHNIFPEIHYETLKDIFGLQVNVTTSAKNKEEGLRMLKLMGFPIQEAKSAKK